MIRPLRRAHHRIWVLLAVLLPLLYAAGLASRRPATPPNGDLRWEMYE
jgi:hypothetical protein